MVEFWDRTTLSVKRPRTPSERSDEDAHMQHPPSGKKVKGKGKFSSAVTPVYKNLPSTNVFCSVCLIIKHFTVLIMLTK